VYPAAWRLIRANWQILLVVLVIYGFLRTVRATIIPAVAIPVSIIGAFAFLYMFDFSINTLTLMGVTLAIGLVVDDAIVVLENITRWVESGTKPLEAARRGMQEISFAVVAATISAVAVFLPLTFLTDETGRLFREFAVVVAAALVVSGFVAVTLSPALCALVVRRQPAEHGVKGALARFFDKLSAGYARLLRPVLRRHRQTQRRARALCLSYCTIKPQKIPLLDRRGVRRTGWSIANRAENRNVWVFFRRFQSTTPVPSCPGGELVP